MMDPPRHACARRAVSRPFTHRNVEQFREMVNDVVATVFSGTDFRNTDVVHDVAMQIPMRVICKLLGIPTEDWSKLQSWTNDFLRIFLPDASAPETLARTQQASQNFIDYFGEMIDQRLDKPRDDLTSEFAAAMDTAGGISRAGLIGALRGLLTAGLKLQPQRSPLGSMLSQNSPSNLNSSASNPSLFPVQSKNYCAGKRPCKSSSVILERTLSCTLPYCLPASKYGC